MRMSESINDETWKLFASPGHSTDHISLYNQEKGILFSGDNVLRSVTTWLGPPSSCLKDYVQSLEKILNLPHLKIIFSAHGRPIENPRERIKDILEHRRQRTNQVMKRIQKNKKGGITPEEIIKTMYPGKNKMKHSIARGWIVLTLKHLEENHQIRRTERKKELRFYPI